MFIFLYRPFFFFHTEKIKIELVIIILTLKKNKKNCHGNEEVIRERCNKYRTHECQMKLPCVLNIF